MGVKYSACMLNADAQYIEDKMRRMGAKYVYMRYLRPGALGSLKRNPKGNLVTLYKTLLECTRCGYAICVISISLEYVLRIREIRLCTTFAPSSNES